MAYLCKAQGGGAVSAFSARRSLQPRQTISARSSVATSRFCKPARLTSQCLLSQPENSEGFVQEKSQIPAQQQYIQSKLAALEMQRLARYNTVREAQTAARLAKLDRVIVKANKRSEERKANQYTLEAKAKLLEKQQQNIQSTLQELDNEQSDVRRRTDFNLAQANHNKTQTTRAKVKADEAKRRSTRIERQLWNAQQELGSLEKLKSSHEEEERSPAETALFDAIMRLGMALEKPLRPAFSAVKADDEKLAWVEDPEVLYL